MLYISFYILSILLGIYRNDTSQGMWIKSLSQYLEVMYSEDDSCEIVADKIVGGALQSSPSSQILALKVGKEENHDESK